jgi:hypothetical protein
MLNFLNNRLIRIFEREAILIQKTRILIGNVAFFQSFAESIDLCLANLTRHVLPGL